LGHRPRHTAHIRPRGERGAMTFMTPSLRLYSPAGERHLPLGLANLAAFSSEVSW